MGRLKLHSLGLHNFKQHRNREWNLGAAPASIIGVVGVNGSGKSTILDSLIFLFTGAIPGDTKEDMVAWKSDGLSYAKGLFSYDDKPLEIYREATSSAAWMKYDGKTYKGVTSVNMEIEDQLKLDKELCRQNMFVRQSEIADILFSDPAVRRKAWQKLMGLGSAETIHAALGNFISALPSALDVTEEIGHNRLRITSVRAEMHKIRKALPAAPPVYETAKLASEQEVLLKALSRIEEVKRLRAAAGETHTVALQARQELDRRESIVKDMEARGAIEHADPMLLSQKMTQLSDIQRSISAFKELEGVADTLEKVSEAVVAASAAMQPEADVEAYLSKCNAEITALLDKAGQLAGTLGINQQLQALMAKMKAGKTVTCPLCMQPIENMDMLRVSLKTRVDAMTAELLEVKKQEDKTRSNYNTAKSRLDRDREHIRKLDSDFKSWNMQKDSLVKRITASVDESAALALQREIAEIERALQSAKRYQTAKSDFEAYKVVYQKAYETAGRANAQALAVDQEGVDATVIQKELAAKAGKAKRKITPFVVPDEILAEAKALAGDRFVPALLTPGKRIGARQLWGGRPAALMRDLTDAALADMQLGVAHYVANARAHAQALADGARES